MNIRHIKFHISTRQGLPKVLFTPRYTFYDTQCQLSMIDLSIYLLYFHNITQDPFRKYINWQVGRTVDKRRHSRKEVDPKKIITFSKIFPAHSPVTYF